MGPLPGWLWVLAGVAGVYGVTRLMGNKVKTTTAEGTTAGDGSLNYYPQSSVAGGQNPYNSANNDNALLESILSIIAAGASNNTAPSPGNSGSNGAQSPGSSGNPGLQPIITPGPATVTTPTTNAIPASVSVPISPPAQATIVPNPIPGDNSVVVVGKTSDGYGYVYGGTQAQANLLGATPAPAPPPAPYSPSVPYQLAQDQALPKANGQENKYITPDGYSFSYG